MRHNGSNVPQQAVRLGDRGRVILPAPIRKHLGLRTGDTLVVTLEDEGAIRLIALDRQLKAIQGMFRKDPKRSLSQELIRDRRREAAREDKE